MVIRWAGWAGSQKLFPSCDSSMSIFQTIFFRNHQIVNISSTLNLFPSSFESIPIFFLSYLKTDSQKMIINLKTPLANEQMITWFVDKYLAGWNAFWTIWAVLGSSWSLGRFWAVWAAVPILAGQPEDSGQICLVCWCHCGDRCFLQC